MLHDFRARLSELPSLKLLRENNMMMIYLNECLCITKIILFCLTQAFQFHLSDNSSPELEKLI